MKVLAVATFETSCQFERWQRSKFEENGEPVEIYSVSFEYMSYTPREKYFINVVYWRT